MSYLNWKESHFALQLPVHFGEPQDLPLELSLKWTPAHIASFLESFQEIEFHPQVALGEELRMSLSPHWVLFWKLRESGSRALLAHPGEKDWVGTIALSVADAKTWVGELAALQAGRSLSLKETLCLDPVSNFNLIIRLENS